MRAGEVCGPGGSECEAKAWKTKCVIQQYGLISQNGCLKAWSAPRGTHGIALNGEDWYDVRHGQLIITPDGTAKEGSSQCLHNLTFRRVLAVLN